MTSKNQRKGAVVERVSNKKTKREGVVRLDKSSMVFFSRVPDQEETADAKGQTIYFESRDGSEVRRWLEQQMKKATVDKPLEWLPIIAIEVEAEDDRRDRDSGETRSTEIKAQIDRYYVALSLDQTEWLTLEWSQMDPNATEFCEEENRISAARHYGHGPKRLRQNHWSDDSIFTIPSKDGDWQYVAYTDDLWAGLNQVFDNLDKSRKTIQELLGTKKGLRMISEVGAGAKLLSSGSMSATDNV